MGISALNFTVIVRCSSLWRIICIKCLYVFMGSTSLLKTFHPFSPLCLLSDSLRDAFSLLCADGTQAPLSHYRSCNLGRGPGGATVTRFNFRKVSQKFLLTVQVPLCHSSLTDSVSIPIIVLLSPNAVWCCSDALWQRRTGGAAVPALRFIPFWREGPPVHRCNGETQCFAR